MSENSSVPSSIKTCELCNDNISKYCCPRCNVIYCSLNCYKSEKHLECSEGFYRDCINEELASTQNDDESKRKMIAILNKMQNENLNDFEETDGEFVNAVDSDDEEELDLQDRINDLNLDDADAVWNALTEDERNEFEALLHQGDVANILPQWEPWWSYSKDARLVQDLGDTEEEEALKNCPKIMNVPELSTLTSVQPSPAISFNITNVLAAYAFTMRYFNGELDPIEGTTYFLNVCANLDTNTNFIDATSAVESVKQKCIQSNLIETDETSMEVMKHDTFFLLQGPSEDNKLHYCLSALSHLYTILANTKSVSKADGKSTKLPKIDTNKLPKIVPTKPPNSEGSPMLQCTETKKVFSKKFPDHKGDHFPNLDANKLKKCMKKVEFYMSFVNSCGLDFE